MSVRSIEAEVSIKSGIEAECTIGREVIVEVHDDVNLEALTATENGSYRPSQGVDGWDRVTVAVPERQPITEPLSVTANGQYAPSEGVDGFSDVTVAVPERVPVTESLSVSQNGLYEPAEGIDGYDRVTVAIPPTIPDIESLTVTENGTYTASGDGYNPVTVQVPERVPIMESLSVTENGTYTPPAGIDGYSSVTVNIPTGGGCGFDDFSGGNIQAIISHGQEYILTDYSGSMQGVFASKFADTNKTSYEGYWSMAYNSNVVGIQRYGNNNNLTIKPGSGSSTGVACPGYAEGEPITVMVASVPTTKVANHPLVIFGNYYNGNLEDTKGAFAFYGLNVFDRSGDLVKKFVPWLNNGVACVKDLVSGTIYANSGTGAFDYIDSESVTHTA